ncbi:MAG: ATP-binding cassette domain-containing protein [Desulfosarcinaceae bacterium]|nr:ATP-binding cassette domain-containing protein [Desulfosarcinaceae bacterium]
MSETIYQLDNITQRYAGKTVLHLPELSLEGPAIVGLIGPNGSGKSTLMRILGFLQAPTSGEVRYRGRPARPFDPAVRFAVTMLPQEPFLMHRTVAANIAYGLKLRGNGGDLEARIAEALDLVGLDPAAFARRQWYQLSGGEAQRVALAARLALTPRVLLMDEPTARVDEASSQRIQAAALEARRERGTTLVIASHDWEWLYSICDTVLCLFRGQLIGGAKGNLIRGPWEVDDRGSYLRRLNGGQLFRVPPPPADEAVAFLAPEAVALNPLEAGPTGHAHLKGILTRLALEPNHRQLTATIMVGDLALSARLTVERVAEQQLYPGRTVTLSYTPASIRWIGMVDG